MKPDRSSVSFAEAQKIVVDSVAPLDCEEIDILRATNRVLCEDIVAGVMNPPFDCSARDGYAVIAADTQGASKENPVRLELVGEIQAGHSSEGQYVSPGCAIRIMTGAPMPKGADAVVQFEDSQEDDGFVRLFCQAKQLDNYRIAGENIKKGEQVLSIGDRLNSGDLGILASLNRHLVTVYRRPTVSIISTGDELAGMGEEAGSGKIRDVNAYALYAELTKYRALPSYLGIAKDNLDDVGKLFRRALHSDVTISTGGGSMGKYDYVRDIYADLGIEMLFERVNVKPGKPCAFGKKGDKLFFSLPGNPVSALTSFIQFVRPALLRLMGAKNFLKPVVSAVLDETIEKKRTKNLRLLRGSYTLKNNQFHVSTTGDQKSSIFKSMRDANCLIIIPENTLRIEAGQKVDIQLIFHDEI